MQGVSLTGIFDLFAETAFENIHDVLKGEIVGPFPVAYGSA